MAKVSPEAMFQTIEQMNGSAYSGNASEEMPLAVVRKDLGNDDLIKTVQLYAAIFKVPLYFIYTGFFEEERHQILVEYDPETQDFNIEAVDLTIYKGIINELLRVKGPTLLPKKKKKYPYLLSKRQVKPKLSIVK
jgi:hypothetical protein